MLPAGNCVADGVQPSRSEMLLPNSNCPLSLVPLPDKAPEVAHTFGCVTVLTALPKLGCPHGIMLIIGYS